MAKDWSSEQRDRYGEPPKRKVDGRGGRREGSGRRTFFAGKSGKAEDPQHGETPPPQQLLLSWKGFHAMEKHCARLTKDHVRQTGRVGKAMRISRNVLFEALVRIYGPQLTLEQIQREDKKS